MNIPSATGLTALVIAAALAPAPAAADSWAAGPDSSQIHPYGVSAELSNGRVLVAGGGGGNSSEGELLSADATSFSPAGAMKQQRIFGAGTLLSNGTVLIAGGDPSPTQSSPVPATAEVWSSARGGTFTLTGPMNVARQVLTLTTLPNGEALAVGGSPYFASGAGSATAELYNPSTNAWTPTGSMPAGRLGHTATLLPDCRVLIVGDNPAAVTYNYVTGTFSPAASEGAFQRSYHTATVMANGKVLIAGGEDVSAHALDTASVYNPATGAFTPTPPMPTAHVQGFAALLPDGRVLVGGGFSGDAGTNPTLSVDIYHPATNTWTTGPSLPSGDIAVSSEVQPLHDGDVMVTGIGPAGRSTAIFRPTSTGKPASPPAENCTDLTGHASFTIRAVRTTARGTIKLTVATTAPGTLTATATTPAALNRKHSHKHPRPLLFGRRKVTAANAGTLTLRISPRHPILALLAEGKSLRVTIKVAYRPSRGARTRAHTTVTVRGHKRTK